MLVITDAKSPVGTVVAEALLADHEAVRMIDTDAAGLESVRERGAEVWPVDPTNPADLSEAFQGAAAAFLSLPYRASRREDFCEYQNKVGDAYAEAVARSGIRHIVSQSCVGAQLYTRSELLAGMHAFEEKLNRIPNVNVIHLRPAHFLEHLGAEILESLNLVVGAISPRIALPIVFPEDVGTLAASLLRKRDFKGHSVRELLGQRDLTMEEFTAALGRQLNNPRLHYVQLPPRTLEQWLMRVGVPKRSAKLIMEVWTLANQGLLEVEPRSAANTTPTSIEEFLAKTQRARSLSQASSESPAPFVPASA